MAILSIALLAPVHETRKLSCPEGQRECPKTSMPETMPAHVARPSSSLTAEQSARPSLGYSRVSKTDLQNIIDKNIPKGLAWVTSLTQKYGLSSFSITGHIVVMFQSDGLTVLPSIQIQQAEIRIRTKDGYETKSLDENQKSSLKEVVTALLRQEVKGWPWPDMRGNPTRFKFDYNIRF